MVALSNARLKEAIESKSIPTRRDASTMQLGISYRGSALARDDREPTATLRAGDRAPDATELLTREGTFRLFDLTRGGRLTLIDFGGDASPVADSRFDLQIFHVVTRPERAGDLVDFAGHLARVYGSKEHSLILIRPDGYIGLISDVGDLSVVAAYLADIG